MIFSICQIRQFSETTECLQDEIIVFVNKIVKIVHECAKRWEGVPTNNNGDRYVLTWKLPTVDDVRKAQESILPPANAGEEAPILDFKTPRIYAPWMKEEPEDFEDLKEEEIPKISEEIADKALISAVKTVAELGRAQDLQAYSRHPKIAPRFGQNYKTRISFGIHVGYAIEGSVGTEMKIDALYLSPDTQIALRIEELCEAYSS